MREAIHHIHMLWFDEFNRSVESLRKKQKPLRKKLVKLKPKYDKLQSEIDDLDNQIEELRKTAISNSALSVVIGWKGNDKAEGSKHLIENEAIRKIVDESILGMLLLSTLQITAFKMTAKGFDVTIEGDGRDETYKRCEKVMGVTYKTAYCTEMPPCKVTLAHKSHDSTSYVVEFHRGGQQ